MLKAIGLSVVSRLVYIHMSGFSVEQPLCVK